MKRVLILSLVLAHMGAIAQNQPAETSAKPVEFTAELKAQLLEEVDRVVTKSAFVPGIDFSKWPEIRAKFQKQLDDAKTPEQFSAAVNSALNSFKASHFVFNSPQAARSFTRSTGIGIGIMPELTPEGIKILEIFAKSPAEEAGLQVGDIIISADGKQPRTMTALRGEAGTKIDLEVKKPDGKTIKVTLTRREFSTARPEETRWLVDKDVAYFKVPSYMTYNSKNVDTILPPFLGAKAMVIDLRSNGGGRVDLLRHMCGYFMPGEKAIGTFITRSLVEYYEEDTNGVGTDLLGIVRYAESRRPSYRVTPSPKRDEFFKGKVIVLVNSGTGSASEMFAAGVRDTVGATIIGSKSAGAVLASSLRMLPGGFMIQFPYQDYVTISGTRLEGAGVKPDIAAGTPRMGQKKDDGVDAALKELVKQGVIKESALAAKS